MKCKRGSVGEEAVMKGMMKRNMKQKEMSVGGHFFFYERIEKV